MSVRSTAVVESSPRIHPEPRKQVLYRNHLEYDDAADAYWRLTVYDPWHAGWWFSNIGGRLVLDHIGRRAALDRDSHALELGSGLGDTCRYVARRFGCRVTGIDMNAAQVTQARRRLASCDAPIEARVRFIRANIEHWRPDRQYEAVYGIDALMYAPRRDRVIRTARTALARNGLLVIADVFAGRDCSLSVRRVVWQKDGILALPSAGDQIEELRRLGFRDIVAVDRTRLAARCFTCVATATRRRRTILVEAKGRERYRRWYQNAAFYRDLFQHRTLTYLQFAARWPR